MRFRTTQYQTVTGADSGQGVLQYTPAMVGVADVTQGTITNASAGYAPQPEAEPMQGVSGRRSMTTRSRGKGGRVPYSYAMPNNPVEAPMGDVGGPAGGRAQGMTGAPQLNQLDTATHGPFKETFAEGRIPISPMPKKVSVLGKWMGAFFTPAKSKHEVQQLGQRTTHDPSTDSTFGTEQNTFIVPDIRRTWNTPSVQGVGTNPKGEAYEAKAGRPIQDPWFGPMKETLVNHRMKVLEDSPPFLPDRTMAGAADPRTQSRPAYVPQWYFMRPFDENMAQHLNGQKGVMRNPLAARPIASAAEPQSQIAQVHTGQLGNLFQSPAPGMTPSGPQPNTLRQSPVPWDSDLYAVGDAQTLRRNFRGRK